MKLALEKLNTPYFILLHEEFFIREKVNTRLIIDLLKILKKEGVGCIRLNPAPGPDKPYKNYFSIGEISSNVKYRFSLQSAIWNKKIFYDILGDDIKIWDVEHNGIKRVNKLNIVLLSVKEPVIDYDPRSAVVRGKFQYPIVRFCKKENISLDLKKRSIDYEIVWREFWNNFRKGPIFAKIKKNSPIQFLFKRIFAIIYKIYKIFLRR